MARVGGGRRAIGRRGRGLRVGVELRAHHDLVAVAELERDLEAAHDGVARLVEGEQVGGGGHVGQLHEGRALGLDQQALLHDGEGTAQRQQLALEAVGRQAAHVEDLRGGAQRATGRGSALGRTPRSEDRHSGGSEGYPGLGARALGERRRAEAVVELALHRHGPSGEEMDGWASGRQERGATAKGT